MSKKKAITFWSTILLFGALWGMAEATVGYVLHFLPALIAGSIMFPFAGVILYQVHRKTDRYDAMLYTGVVAAAIKGVNLLLPQYSIFKTINPMISIVFETLLVTAFIAWMAPSKDKTLFIALPLASIGWRVLYLAYMGVQYAATGFLAAQLQSAGALVSFVMLEGILSAAIAVGLGYAVREFLSRHSWNIRWHFSYSVMSVALAVALTLLL